VKESSLLGDDLVIADARVLSCIRLARMAVSAERLQAVPLFSTLSGDEFAALLSHFEERQVLPGTRLTTEGASGYTFFVIETGTVEVERDGNVINTLGPGDFFGETAILSGDRRNATITAVTDVDLLVLFGTEFRILERDWPDVAAKIAEKTAERDALASQTD
jgi:CRP/FNR family cyclic AMP-dependent transcriptional regulator